MKNKIYDFNPLLKNWMVLYFFFFLSIIDVFYFMNTKDYASLIVFMFVAFLTTFFSKNMIVVLCLALCLTNIIKYGANGVRVNEGFDNKDKDKKDKKEGFDSKDKDEKDKKDKKEGLSNSKNTDKEIEKSLEQFNDIKDQIIERVNDMQPLLEKAEGFVEKYTDYAKSKGIETFKEENEGYEENEENKNKKPKMKTGAQ
jgi:hypothetical protein